MDINFDQFQKEINAAETLLRADVFRSQDSQDLTSTIRNSATGRISFEGTRKTDILQQFGRRPFQPSSVPSDWGNDNRQQPQQYEEREIDVNSPDSVDAEEVDSPDASMSSRYSEPSQREKLLNRLLAEHQQRKATSSTRGGITAESFDSKTSRTAKGAQILRFSLDADNTRQITPNAKFHPSDRRTPSNSTSPGRGLNRTVPTSSHSPHSTSKANVSDVPAIGNRNRSDAPRGASTGAVIGTRSLDRVSPSPSSSRKAAGAEVGGSGMKGVASRPISASSPSSSSKSNERARVREGTAGGGGISAVSANSSSESTLSPRGMAMKLTSKASTSIHQLAAPIGTGTGAGGRYQSLASQGDSERDREPDSDDDSDTVEESDVKYQDQYLEQQRDLQLDLGAGRSRRNHDHVGDGDGDGDGGMENLFFASDMEDYHHQQQQQQQSHTEAHSFAAGGIQFQIQSDVGEAVTKTSTTGSR